MTVQKSPCVIGKITIGPKEWDLVVPDAQAVLGVQQWTNFDRSNTQEEVWDVCTELRTLIAQFLRYTVPFFGPNQMLRQNKFWRGLASSRFCS
jgi:hypothetical protein